MRLLRLLSFGELLWDIFSSGDQPGSDDPSNGAANRVEHIGGAAFNLAANAALCGFEAQLLSRVGTDDLGQRALEAAKQLKVNGVNRDGADTIQTDPDHPTGTVTVTLGPAGQPTYVIHAPVAWDFIAANAETLAKLTATPFDVICFGTLAQRSEVSRHTLQQLLTLLPARHRFFDVNLRQHYYSHEIVEHGLRHATIIKLNDEELPTLSTLLYSETYASKEEQELEFARHLLRDYPQLHIVLVTKGADGCLVVERKPDNTDKTGTEENTEENTEKSPVEDSEVEDSEVEDSEGRTGGYTVIRVPGIPVDPAKIADTVGAGDAFSAAFLASLLSGHSAAEAARAGNERGAYIVTIRGAIPPVED